MAISLGLLAGCNAPGPDFRGIDPARISVGKSTFDVRVIGNRAQAIRLNPEWAPRRAATAPRGIAAIEVVSGCKVRTLGGDQAVMVARLECGKAVDASDPARAYECDFEHISGKYTELVCEPAI